MKDHELIIRQMFNELPEPPSDDTRTVDHYNNLAGYYSLMELICYGNVEFPPRSTLADHDLDYTPPKISDELFEYSLKGLESIKV